MSDTPRCLLVEDLPTDAEIISRWVRRALPGCDIHLVETREAFLAALETFRPDIILSDYQLPRFDGLSALALAIDHVPDIPFVIVTGSMNEETAVACMKAGAWDYVIKEHSRRLETVILAALERAEQRRAQRDSESALVQSEERFRTITEASPDAIFVCDRTGRYTFVNAMTCEMLGYTHDALVKMNIRDVVAPEWAPSQSERFGRLLKEGRLAAEIALIRRDGSIVPVDLNAVVLPNGTIYGSCRDISERKEAEAERERLEGQLRQAVKMEAVGRLAGGVAHDYNNMLSVIIGHAEMALDILDPLHSVYTDLQQILKAAKRSAELTRQLLAFARRQTIAPKVLDLNDAVESTLGMLNRLVGEEIRVVWKPEPRPCLIKMDPSQIDQTLTNLIVNARDAIDGVGRITIETRTVSPPDETDDELPSCPQGNYVMLSVSDTGCGMDANTLEHLFEPFFTTKAVGKGTGLGLATVFGVVKQNQGHIRVESEVAKGSTFRIYLPCVEEKAQRHEKQETPDSLRRGREVVLLVEDEPSLLQMEAAMLRAMGYEVLVAGTPRDALRLARSQENEIDLLLTDVIMPQMNGGELAAKLCEENPQLVCVFMSGYTANMITENHMLGADTHLIEKPFSMRDLSATIRAALDQRVAT